MNVQERLEQIGKLDQLIVAKIAERDRLQEIAVNVSSCPMDGMPHSNTGMVSQRMENAVLQLIMLEQELNKIIDQYVDCKQAVVKALETLPEKEYGVLHRHYIRYMTWEQVAEDMGYSTTQIWRIKKNGLKILQDVIECNAEK